MIDQRLAARIAALFDAEVAVALTDPRADQPELLPQEAACIASAIPARQREFAAGRTAARAALAQLGGAALPVPAGPDRAPLWPNGWRGSITHGKSLCIAILTRAEIQIGIDLEAAEILDEDIIPTICSENELSRIDGLRKSRLAALIFCAKEAAYKAQYPLTGTLLDFHDLDVTLNTVSLTFTATFLKSAPPFAIGDTLRGRWLEIPGHLVSVVTIGQVAGDES